MAIILFSDTNEATARHIRKDKDPKQEGFTLVRAWPFLDITVADTLSTTLDAVTTVVDPKSDNQPYEGTFANGRVVLSEDSETGERYGVITQDLILLTTPTNIATLAALAAIVTQRNEIVELFEINTGERDFQTFSFKNLNPTSRADMMAISDADLVSNLPGEGWTYADRDFDEQTDNTATFRVVFQKAAFVFDNNELLTFGGSNGTKSESETIIWPNINASNATAHFNNARTNTANMTAASPAAPAGHKLDFVSRVPAELGKYRVTRVTFIPKNTSTVWLTASTTKQINWYQFSTVRDTGDGLTKRYYRIIKIDQELRQLVTLEDAQSQMDEGIDIGPFHSKTDYRGPGKYVSVKYTLNAANPLLENVAWIPDAMP